MDVVCVCVRTEIEVKRMKRMLMDTNRNCAYDSLL